VEGYLSSQNFSSRIGSLLLPLIKKKKSILSFLAKSNKQLLYPERLKRVLFLIEAN
jgi:hypothetical protein